MNRKIAALLTAVALTVSLGACTVQVGSPDEENTPAPTQSSDEGSVSVNQDLMQQAWDGLSYNQQQTICTLGPDYAAKTFYGEVTKGGNPTNLTLDEAQQFFAGVC
jgi:hypothetical protein